MATFGRGRLVAPIIDNDLRQVDVDSLGNTTVVSQRDFWLTTTTTPLTLISIPYPVSEAGLDYGYYTDATGLSDSWALALKTALDAADPDSATWTIAEVGGNAASNVARLRFTRSTGGTFGFNFSTPGATIRASLLGFSGNAVTSTGTLDAPWAVPHCWRPGTLSWLTKTPMRNIEQVKTASVKTSNHLTGGTQVKLFIPTRNLPIAKVLKTGVVRDLDIAAVAGLTEGDPNFPLEATWEVAWNHLPLRFLPDESQPGQNTTLLQVDGGGALSEIESFITALDVNIRYYDVDVPVMEWAPIGGKEFDIHAVVCAGGGGGFTDYDTLELASSADIGSAVRVTQVADASVNAPDIVYEGVRVDEPWFFEPHPLIGNRWLPGKIGTVGAPGSGSFLVYRAVDGTPFTFLANMTLGVNHTSAKELQWWMTAGIPTIGVEVAIPLPRGGSIDTVVSYPDVLNFAIIYGGAFTTSDWLGGLMSSFSGGGSSPSVWSYGVYGGAANAAFQTVPIANFRNLPTRLQWVVTQQNVDASSSQNTYSGYQTSVDSNGLDGLTGPGLSWINDSRNEVQSVRAFVGGYGNVDAVYTVQTIGCCNQMSEQGFGGSPI